MSSRAVVKKPIMDIFETPMKETTRNRSTRRIEGGSEMTIRMVLPAEQTVAIAKSMIERQSKPEEFGVIWGASETKTDRKPRKRVKKQEEAPATTKKARGPEA